MINAETDKVMEWLKEISLRPCDFTREDYDAYETEILVNTVIDMVERNKPEEVDIEGGGTTWWYVCGDCHGAIDTRDSYCRH